ncbi:MAG: MEKHLA domain-containing protein [Pseudomonadota bacterium]
MSSQAWEQISVVKISQMILDSYEHWLGKSLCSREGSPEKQAKRLFLSPFVVTCHGNEAEPIFCYGNQKALELFETEWDSFVKMPSRQSAEAMHRTERAEMLKRALLQGFIDNYQGIRISSKGIRFRIENGTIWNVQDFGQAATFAHWQII